MSESVKILIEAENKASDVIASTAKDIDAKVKSIKQSGEQAKKSTEFFGTIANALGGSELGQFASQLGQVTEKTSQFAEVQKLGGAGAFAFKAGLVAAVGVIAFQVGSAIGNAIFQTEKWSEKLKEASDKAKELASSAAAIRQTQFTERKEDIEIFQDPEKKRAEYEKLLAEVKTNLAGVENQSRTSKKAAEEWQAAWQITGDRKGFAAQAKQQAEEDADRVKALQAQQVEIEKILSPRTEENRLLREKEELDKQAASNVTKIKEEIDALNGMVKALSTEEEALIRKRDLLKEQKQKETASDAFLKQLREEVAMLRVKKEESFAIEAGQKTVGAQAGAEAAKLLQEKELLTAKRDAEKKAEDDKIAKAKQIADLRQRELDRLEEERIALTQGKEAARAFALEKQGLSKDDARKFAGEQAANEKLKEEKDKAKKQVKDVPTLQAKESRLLTRGEGDDPTKQVAINTANSLRELQLLNKRLLDSQLKTLNVKVVGGKP